MCLWTETQDTHTHTLHGVTCRGSLLPFHLIEIKNIVHNFIAKSDLYVVESGITGFTRTPPLSKKKKSIISRDVAIEPHVFVMRLFSVEVTWLQLVYIIQPITIYLKNKKGSFSDTLWPSYVIFRNYRNKKGSIYTCTHIFSRKINNTTWRSVSHL